MLPEDRRRWRGDKADQGAGAGTHASLLTSDSVSDLRLKQGKQGECVFLSPPLLLMITTSHSLLGHIGAGITSLNAGTLGRTTVTDLARETGLVSKEFVWRNGIGNLRVRKVRKVRKYAINTSHLSQTPSGNDVADWALVFPVISPVTMHSRRGWVKRTHTNLHERTPALFVSSQIQYRSPI